MIHVERIVPKTDQLDRLEVFDDDTPIGNVTCVKGQWVARVKWARMDDKAYELPGGAGGDLTTKEQLIEVDTIAPQTAPLADQQAAVDLVVMMHAYWAMDAHDPDAAPPPKDPPNATDEGWAMWPEDEN